MFTLRALDIPAILLEDNDNGDVFLDTTFAFLLFFSPTLHPSYQRKQSVSKVVGLGRSGSCFGAVYDTFGSVRIPWRVLGVFFFQWIEVEKATYIAC